MPEDDEKSYDSEAKVPPFQQYLDPDNAPSPLPFDKRKLDGEKKFYPEGGPEDPPVTDFEY